VLKPFDISSADLFTRDGLAVTDSPQSIWDWLVPWLLALIILDVAVRRIAWDWPAIQRMAMAVADYVRQFTMTYRKVESPRMLDSLKRVREGVAEQKFKAPAEIQAKSGSMPLHPMPDPSAKFDAGAGIEGDITAVVGGAVDKPIPSAPRNIEPKGAVGLGEHTGGLLEAKRRAQQKIKQQQEQN
jgi:hypothetical protein